MTNRNEVYSHAVRHFFRSMIHAQPAQNLSWNMFRKIYQQAKIRAAEQVNQYNRRIN